MDAEAKRPNEKLKYHRELRGWSQKKVAGAIDTSKDMVSRWETGERHVSPYYQEKLCTLFGLSAIDLGFLVPSRQEGIVIPPSPPSQEVLSLLATAVSQGILLAAQEWSAMPSGTNTFLTDKDAMDKKRRELLLLLSRAGMVFALPLPDLDWSRIAGALTRPSRFDVTMLDDLETMNRSLWSTYLTTLIKSSVLESALGHFKMLMQFLKASHPHTSHQRLCALTSEMGQLVGEIFFDLNDHEAAESCYTFAALSAKEGQSYDLWSCALVRSAFLPMYRQRYEDALLLLQNASTLAQRGDSALPTKYWVAAVEAEAQAGVHDLAACQHALDQAQSVQEVQGTPPSWVRFRPARLPALCGACYIRLRQPERAMPALQNALQHFPKPDRKRGMALIDLAAAAVQLGEVEQARTYVDEVIAIITFGSSGFLREELQTLPGRVETMASTTSVKALHQYIEQQLQLSPLMGN
jgi:transcriptional regulator with XRE-family HTH domain